MLIFFYILAVLSVLGALSLILARSPIYSALGLVASLIALAGVYVLLEQEFVAAMQILIYAGAIMVLFLFVIMLLNLRQVEGAPRRITLASVLGVSLAVLLLGQLLSVVFHAPAGGGVSDPAFAARLAEEGDLALIGELLLTTHVLPFEVVSVVLMIAIIGAVLLARRRFPYVGPAAPDAPASAAASADAPATADGSASSSRPRAVPLS